MFKSRILITGFYCNVSHWEARHPLEARRDPCSRWRYLFSKYLTHSASYRVTNTGPGVAGASGAVARAPRQPSTRLRGSRRVTHTRTDLSWLARCWLTPPLKRGVVLPITATPPASSVTASSLVPRPLLSTVRFSQSFRTAASAAFAFAVSFHTVTFCSARPYIPFPHTAALSSARLPAHGCPSQLSPFRSLLAHDFRRIRSPLPAFASFTVFRTRRSPLSQPSHTAFRTRSLSATIAFRSLLAHGCL